MTWKVHRLNHYVQGFADFGVRHFWGRGRKGATVTENEKSGTCVLGCSTIVTGGVRLRYRGGYCGSRLANIHEGHGSHFHGFMCTISGRR